MSAWLADRIILVHFKLSKDDPNHLQLSSWEWKAVHEAAPVIKSLWISKDNRPSIAFPGVFPSAI